MQVFFQFVFTITVGVIILRIVFVRDWFSIYTYILFGVFLPIMLFFAKWSGFVNTNACNDFYLLFIELCLAIQLFLLVEKPNNAFYLRGKIVSCNRQWIVLVFTIAYVSACLLENYLASGRLLPSIAGIDVHTFRAPVLCYLTKAIYPVCVLNYLSIITSDRISTRVLHALLIIIIIGIYIVGKGARMEVAEVLLQLGSFALFLDFRKMNDAILHIPRKRIVEAIFIFFVFVFVFSLVGAIRTTQYGRYDVQYSYGIDYQGPSFLGEYIAWYYGYFPMSFNNLNLSISQVGSTYNLLGLNTWKFLYFGLFQLDNVLGIDGYAAEHAGLHVIREATVNTGFWNIYYDYGILAFVVFVLALFGYRILRDHCERDNCKLSSYCLYFYWIPLWFFMSFQNTVFDLFILSDYFLISILVANTFKIDYDVTSLVYTKKGEEAN